MSFFSVIEGFFTSFNSKLKAFFAGPGGDIVKQALANAVKIAGAEAMSLLVQVAKNEIAGKPVLTNIDWAGVSQELGTYAIQHGIVVTESLLDFAIAQAVTANAVPGALPQFKAA